MKGETIQLVVKTKTGTDPFGAPIYTEELVNVDDVLIGQPSSDDVISELSLSGKTIAYMLGIPKGDAHNWVDTEVQFWGKRFRTIGIPITGTQANIPLRWGQNIKVEAYE